MKHHQNKPEFKFVKEPVEFDKHTEKQLLQYCLGATLYMPATKDFARVIMKKEMLGLTSMVMCFEDAIKEEDLPEAETNTINFLNKLCEAKDSGLLMDIDIPLIFFRVRSPEQFFSISEKLEPKHTKVLAGIVFPKFSTKNGDVYFSRLKELNNQLDDIIYAMPLLEGREIAFKESRESELKQVRNIIDRYREITLNIRVGATDFSSCFGVRRGIDYTIYDILTVRDCLKDILNVFSRDNDYVISGPVWEYFLADKNTKSLYLEDSIHESLLKRNNIVNPAIDGLLREVIIDKANGFVGKTIIHPTHLKYVNAMHTVTEEEYNDAVQILNTSGGVVKSEKANKMNEIKPHNSWAYKIFMKAQAYGVIEDETSYFKLF